MQITFALRALGSVTALALCLCNAAQAAAPYLWGNDGHKIVAKIAYDNLNSTAKAEVDNLLDGDELPTIAMWADEVKSKPSHAHTRPWHFADMDADEDTFSLVRDCPSEGCVVQAILDAQTTLANANAPKSDRQEALKFLVHFVGDIHQPLHVGRAADKGGNSINVKFFGASGNLHALWDSGLIKRKGKAWPTYTTELEGKITSANRQAWQAVTDPVEWASESHKLAEDHCYRTPSGANVDSGDSLGQDYYDDGIEVVEEQLMKAGLRLAASLNAIYGGSPSGGGNGNGGATAIEVKFVGSRKSEVYHLPSCKDAEKIHPDNFVEYTAAPPGKRLHKDCPRR